jgi:hypothetical protein
MQTRFGSIFLVLLMSLAAMGSSLTQIVSGSSLGIDQLTESSSSYGVVSVQSSNPSALASLLLMKEQLEMDEEDGDTAAETNLVGAGSFITAVDTTDLPCIPDPIIEKRYILFHSLKIPC